MFDMRIRIPELLDARDWTPYRLAKASKGRISITTAYRVAKKRGRLGMLDPALLDALCDVLNVGPGELLEREGKRARR